MNLSTTRTQIRPAGQAPTSPSVAWSYAPLREQPRVAWSIVGTLVVAAVLALVVTGKFHLAILALLAGFVVFRRVMLRTRYELGPAGVKQHCLGRSQTTRWASVAEVRELSDGLEFTTEPCWRGFQFRQRVAIPVHDDRDEAMACAKAYAVNAAMTKDQAPITNA